MFIIKGMLSVGDTPFLSINAIHIGQSLSQLILYLIKLYKKAKVLFFNYPTPLLLTYINIEPFAFQG
jgi:hypothetical protein